MNDTDFNFFCGIDISKKDLDFTFIDENKNKLFFLKVSNTKVGIKKLLKYSKQYGIELNKTLFCCENTGIYTLVLANLLHKYNYNLWVENALSIINSQGITRGKNDQIDSYRIAKYSLRFKDKCTLWTPSNRSLEKVKHLFTLRERLQKSIKQLTVPLNEVKNIIDKKFYNQLKQLSDSPLKSLKEGLKTVNKDLENIISEDEKLNKNYELAMSVPHIGKVSAMYLLMCTDNFNKIKTYRKGACYAGIAPFEYSSGTSIRGKTKVSKMGNKDVKKLLHTCTLSILKQKKGELYEYFKRKLEEGKHTMSVLNALRNKLLNRVFACVNNGVKYNPEYLTQN
jgi:transposase